MRGAALTIGHSTHTLDHFLSLLRLHEVSAIADVRSIPWSRMSPQFGIDVLEGTLREVGIAYVFLGRELGARTMDKGCYRNGRVQYGRLAETADFRRGLERVRDGAGRYRLALMCTEKDPIDCHRAVLISRHLVSLGIEVQHVHADGRLESHSQALDRLVRQLRIEGEHMFRTREDVLADAYLAQEERIAYRPSGSRLDPQTQRATGVPH